MQANERHKAIVELYLDILGFSKRDRISENPFIQIETSSVNDYKDWRGLLEQMLKYDESKMLMYSFILNESEIERNGKNIFTPDKKLTLVLDRNKSASYYSTRHSITLNHSIKPSDEQEYDDCKFTSEIMTNSIDFRNFGLSEYKNTNDDEGSLFHELLHSLHSEGRNKLFYDDVQNSNSSLTKKYSKCLIDSVKHQFYIPDNHTYNPYEAKLIINYCHQFRSRKRVCLGMQDIEELFVITGLPYKSFFGYGLSEDLLNFNIGRTIPNAHILLSFRYNTDAIACINNKETYYSELIKYNLQQMNNYFQDSNYHNCDKIKYIQPLSGKTFDLKYSTMIECYALGTRFCYYDKDKPVRKFFRSLELASNGVYGVQSSFTEQSLVDFITKISQLSIGFRKISEYNRTLTEKKSLLDNEFTIKTNKLLEDFEKSQDDTNLYEAQVEYLQWITDHTEFLKNINTVVGTVVGYANTNLIELKNIYQNTPDELERLKNKFLTPYLELEPLTKLEGLNCPQIDCIYSFQDSKVAKEHFDKIKEVYVPLSHNIDVIKNKLATFFKKIDANIAV